MSLISKRLVSIAASTVLLSVVSTSANAQGKWYTDYTEWRSLVTNFFTAEYNSFPDNPFDPWVDNDIIATCAGGWFYEPGFLEQYSEDPVTFTILGSNAFGGYFAREGGAGNLNFTVDGSQLYDLNVAELFHGNTFLGYISDSSSDINVTVSTSGGYVAVDSFSRAYGTNPSNPGSNVAPEPGSFALALTGGAALLGICVRRRRNAG